MINIKNLKLYFWIFEFFMLVFALIINKKKEEKFILLFFFKHLNKDNNQILKFIFYKLYFNKAFFFVHENDLFVS